MQAWATIGAEPHLHQRAGKVQCRIALECEQIPGRGDSQDPDDRRQLVSELHMPERDELGDRSLDRSSPVLWRTSK